jgi:hypothetical protein
MRPLPMLKEEHGVAGRNADANGINIRARLPARGEHDSGHDMASFASPFLQSQTYQFKLALVRPQDFFSQPDRLRRDFH